MAAGVSTAAGSVPAPRSVPSEAVRDAAAGFAGYHLLFLVVGSAVAIGVIFSKTRLFRGGGLDRGGARDPTSHPAVLWLFAAIVVILLQGMAAGLVRDWMDIGPMKDALGGVKVRGAVALAAGGVGLAAAIGMAVLLARPTSGRGGERSGLRVRLVDVPIGLGWFALAYPIVGLGGWLAAAAARRFLDASADPIAHETLSDITKSSGNPWAWGLIFGAAFAAPVVEELVYRGMVQSAVRRVVRSAWAAVVITSAGFCLMHWTVVPEGSRHQLVTLLLLSVAFGAAFERTRSIGVPIVMHACFNGLNILLALAAT